MVRSLSFPFTLALAVGASLALGACDRQSAEPAQPQESAAEENQSGLTGTVDRSHAGEALPDITITDPNGTELLLASLEGEPVLLNLWATWCAPCVIEMPMLDEIAGMEGTPRVITVSQDLKGAEAVNPFFAERGFAHLEPWLDPQNDLSFHYGGGGAVLPTTILYGADGKEVLRVIGGFDWSGAEAMELLAEAPTTG